MASDVKSGVGFIIPAIGVVGFFISLLMGEFLLSIIISVMVILIWFLYMLGMESHIPREMGNTIMLFGVMLSLGIFFGFGIIVAGPGGYCCEEGFVVLSELFGQSWAADPRRSNLP